MKNACIVISSLLSGVVSVIYALTAEKRARAGAERTFAGPRAALERQITEKVLAQLTNRVVYTSRGTRSGASAQPEYGLWYPTLPPKRLD